MYIMSADKPSKFRGPVEIVFEFLEENYGYTEEEITGRAREKHLHLVRTHAYVILREKGFALTFIGDVMGGRNHATVIKAMNGLFASEHRAMIDSFDEWEHSKKKGNYVVVRLTFADGMSCIGYTRMISPEEVMERTHEVQDRFNCRAELMRGNLCLEDAQKMEQVEKLRQEFTGGKDEK